MPTNHKLISIWNIISLLIFTIGFILPKNIASYFFLVGMVSGYFANLIAIIITLLLSILYFIAYFDKKHKIFFYKHKLGFINGLFVILFWNLIVYIL